MKFKHICTCENCGKEKEMEISYTVTPLSGRADMALNRRRRFDTTAVFGFPLSRPDIP